MGRCLLFDPFFRKKLRLKIESVYDDFMFNRIMIYVGCVRQIDKFLSTKK